MAAPTLTPRPPAGTKVQIPVRQEHIDRGRPCQAGDCALALAIAEVFPGSTGVAVVSDHDDGYRPSARVWVKPTSWIRLAFGDDARDFMDAFDDEQPVGPAVFSAEVA